MRLFDTTVSYKRSHNCDFFSRTTTEAEAAGMEDEGVGRMELLLAGDRLHDLRIILNYGYSNSLIETD